MDEFFTTNLIAVFFFYGLAFFSMGLAILLEVSHSSELDFSKALIFLAGFGLIHGCHEWFEMGLIINTRISGQSEPAVVFYLRILLLCVCFVLLIIFGANMIIGSGKFRLKIAMLGVILLLWISGLSLVLSGSASTVSKQIATDAYTRYALAIPGAALTAWGLILQRKKFIMVGMPAFGNDVALAAIAFALYGGIGQLFVTPTNIFPSAFLNSTVFLQWFGFPIQVFRALMAIIAAVFIIRSLRAFDEENRRRIQELGDAQRKEQQRLQAMRDELLHRTVRAQEQERHRIARELHDETGQTLTTLGLGLKGLTQNILNQPQRAIEQAQQLQEFATTGLTDLQRLVSGLHPFQLDELGLAAALRWYAQETGRLDNIEVSFTGPKDQIQLPDEVKLTFFRIAQEAITNVVRHARAKHIWIRLEMVGKKIQLEIEDDGQGFHVAEVLGGDEQKSFGLLGVMERAALIGGTCQIKSSPGKGTTIEVQYDCGRDR
jgi:signal transduction histidine kinase